MGGSIYEKKDLTFFLPPGRGGSYTKGSYVSSFSTNIPDICTYIDPVARYDVTQLFLCYFNRVSYSIANFKELKHQPFLEFIEFALNML